MKCHILQTCRDLSSQGTKNTSSLDTRDSEQKIDNIVIRPGLYVALSSNLIQTNLIQGPTSN